MALVPRFRETLRTRPQDTAVLAPERACTWRELGRLVVRAQARVRALRLPRHALIGLASANGPGFLAGLIALRADEHPVALMDGATPEAERERISRSLGVLALLDAGDGWPRRRRDWTVRRLDGDVCLPDTAVVKLTSGSTGEPRGIRVSERALAADTAALHRTMAISAQDRFLASIPWSHSYGFSLLAMSALSRGNLLVVPDGHDPLAVARAADATVFPTVPAYLNALVRRPDAPPWPPSLGRVITAGAPLAPTTARAFRERFGAGVHVFYGASECGGICYDRAGSAGERGTVGTPVEGVAVTLEDGRVVVDSRAVADAYIPSSCDRLREGRFFSEDLAEWRDGELALVGRVSDWINVDGRKVNPREVERVLEQIPGAREAYVFGDPSPDDGKLTVCAVVACAPRRLDYATVLRWCRERLAPYKVPRSITLVREIPRTPRGKPDRRALTALTE